MLKSRKQLKIRRTRKLGREQKGKQNMGEIGREKQFFVGFGICHRQHSS
jgi:hypothetical protein